MKIKLLILFVLFCICSGCDYFSTAKQKEISESPERIFNLANEAMIKGERDIAIELYYKIIEEYPEFKKYRPDVLYRLGMLLFKAERFEEAEKILYQLTIKYKNYPRIKKVYEKLLYIYIQEIPHPAKAEKIKKIYMTRFKDNKKIAAIEKTIVLLNSNNEKENLFKLDVLQIETKKIEKIKNYDDEFFPVRSILDLKVFSPDRKYFVERKKVNETYFLFLTDISKNQTKKIIGSENGFGQQWSWDSRFIIFTVMDWTTKERKIKLYNIINNNIQVLFTGKNIGDLMCFSPDNSKICFWYYDNLWLINISGKKMSMICKTIKEDNVSMVAWSRDGDKILVEKRLSDNINYYLLHLGRKEFSFTK